MSQDILHRSVSRLHSTMALSHSSLPVLSQRPSSSETERLLYSASLAHMRRQADYSDFYQKPAPYYIRWVYGYNSKAELINLNCRGSTTVFYAACNCGVLYNWTTNQMRILQGHRHMVTCVAADADGKWLVTADSGPENIITIWDSKDYFPNKTYFLPHGDMAVSKVALSADAKYMLTLGKADCIRTDKVYIVSRR